jgi:thiamine-monophosphate kinase
VREVAEAAGADPLELAVSGGEDYELLAALPPARLEEAARAVAGATGTDGEPLGLTRVGRLVEGSAVEIRRPDGSSVEPQGFDQLTRARRPR